MTPALRKCRALERMAELEALCRIRAWTAEELADYQRCINSENTRQAYHRRMGRAA